jgi:hypothetical protein
VARRKQKTTVQKNKLPVYTRRLPSGQLNCIVDLRTLGGKRKYKTYSDLEYTRLYAEQAWLERQNQGIEAFNIPPHLKLEAKRCAERLQPHGATLTQAVDYYLEHAVRFTDAPM